MSEMKRLPGLIKHECEAFSGILLSIYELYERGKDPTILFEYIE